MAPLMNNFKKWLRKQKKKGGSQAGSGKRRTQSGLGKKRRKKQVLEKLYQNMAQKNSFEPNTRMATYLMQNGV